MSVFVPIRLDFTGVAHYAYDIYSRVASTQTFAGYKLRCDDTNTWALLDASAKEAPQVTCLCCIASWAPGLDLL